MNLHGLQELEGAGGGEVRSDEISLIMATLSAAKACNILVPDLVKNMLNFQLFQVLQKC